MRSKGTPGELEQRRIKAIQLLEEGRRPVEVARVIGVDRRSVRRWKSAYRKKGMDAVRYPAKWGRPVKISSKQSRQLERDLLRGAKSCGFSTDLWSCPRVAKQIQRRYGISYHVDHIGRLLRRMGWSPQRPARRAIERNEVAIRRWVKEKWPRCKKKPTT